MKFMAPELLRGEGRPNVETDLYSLAVLLFMVFVNGHPMEGAVEASIICMDENAERRIYGEEPVFVYDPRDHSNRPQPGIHDTVLAVWPTLPTALQELFRRSFGEGLHDPKLRITEWTWAKHLSSMHDSLFSCGKCSRLNVFDAAGHARTGVVGVCWACQHTLAAPPRLHYGPPGSEPRRIVLDPAARLFEHHLHDRGDHDFTAPIARGSRPPHTTRPLRAEQHRTPHMDYHQTRKAHSSSARCHDHHTARHELPDQRHPILVGLMRNALISPSAKLRASSPCGPRIRRPRAWGSESRLSRLDPSRQ